jgi:hypothetical protein
MRKHRMNAILFCITLLASVALTAQSYPHAFPRAGATKIFENNRVAIWQVVWHHGVEQPFHRHLYDMAGVYLRYGRIKVTQPPGVTPPSPSGASTAGQPYEVPRQLFQRAGITHKEEGVGQPSDPEQFAFQTDLKGYSPVYPAPNGGAPDAFPRDGAKKGIESDRVVFWDYTWLPGKPTGLHFHDKDRVEVFVTGGTLRTTGADGHQQTEEVAPWSARFVEGGRVDNEEATGDAIRAVVFELKQAQP